MKPIIILILSCLSCWACSESGLQGYDADSYIAFKKENIDSTLFSFAYDETLREGSVKIEMDMIAPASPAERKYRIIFLPAESTATEGVDFIKVDEEQIVPADSSRASFNIVVKKTESLTDKEVIAVFEVRPSSDFQVSFATHNRARLLISDKLGQPEWWNNWHLTSGLGTYSNKKYRLFINEIHEYNLDYENRDDMDYYQMRSLVLEFKHWLEKHPQTEADGAPMELAIKG